MRLLPYILIAIVALLAGCPGFEDAFSGTYREEFDPENRGAQLRAVDVFRRGDSIQAIVRTYESVASQPSEAEPFGLQLTCQLTTVGTLTDDNSFELFYADSSTRLTGRFVGNDLTIRLNSTENTPDLLMPRFGSEPDAACETIEPKSLSADFSGATGVNEFDEGVYEILDPHFGVQWLSVEERDIGGLNVFLPATAALIAAPIPEKVSGNRRGLTGAFRFDLEPPPRGFRTPSGRTEYSLAHLIVVDDDPDENGSFSWDKDTEPIIASGVRKGTRQIPEGWDAGFRSLIEGHNRFGRAVLYVDGRLDQLDPAMLDTFDNWEAVADDAGEHFWVVEVFAANDEVLGLRFTESVRTVPVVVTSDYLDDSQITLPRLFPAN